MHSVTEPSESSEKLLESVERKCESNYNSQRRVRVRSERAFGQKRGSPCP